MLTLNASVKHCHAYRHMLLDSSFIMQSYHAKLRQLRTLYCQCRSLQIRVMVTTRMVCSTGGRSAVQTLLLTMLHLMLNHKYR